ncbi:ABC transporter substrate-binding protein [Deinococcus cellulosilyticus]|uniref:ABC transporter substrate-binding protein n=1 Tax=Deinococcus cellulosilyticus (strain DSM 18568 / NBRC 106333 / KACC 11606 / 5516J-15) TaxID=1223518 RepID=A0A511N1L3_DEIC1|nr:ABC transporter substrate-binding protein [Deinococcus cellulosilyticus]GEM46752.1 ABC transporter substrate-binding protein [Deinococcus cellulosilyticus NBRC 106333 = KACC 11606]
MKKSVLLIAAFALAAQASAKPIVVASKLDPEAQLLGQIILLTLKDAGFDVTDKTSLGDTGVARKAILSGEIDVYPEYTGNAVYLFPEAKISSENAQNPKVIHKLAKDLDARNGITWLNPANVNNTWALALPAKFARANKLSSYADLAGYLNKGGNLKVAGSPEFFNRPDAFQLFENTYGFKLKADQKLLLAGATPLQTQQAAASGQNGVNAAMAYGTDGTIAALDLVVLKDPKNAQPVYQPAPIIRTEVLKANPKIQTLLNKAFRTLNQSGIQKLNAQIAVEGKPARDVAAAFLKSKGIIK